MSPPSRHTLLSWATHDVLTLEALRAHRVSEEEIRTLLRRDHLFRQHYGVFLVTDRPSYKTRCFAAVTHCGDDGQVSFFSGAYLWDVGEGEPEGWPSVTVHAHRMTHKAASIRVHRSRRPDTGSTRDGIPVTTLERTIDDCARTMTIPALKRMIGRAERNHAVDLGLLFEKASSRKLRSVLATYVAGRGLTDSELEARFYEIVIRAGLPKPQKQRRRAGGRVDFVWPELGLIVEVDGWDSHRGRVAFQEDRTRDRENWRAGLQTLRFTWSDVVLTPTDVIADLLLAIERVA